MSKLLLRRKIPLHSELIQYCKRVNDSKIFTSKQSEKYVFRHFSLRITLMQRIGCLLYLQRNTEHSHILLSS